MSRQLTACGLLLVTGYAGLFCLLQSPALWYSLRPDPMRSLISEAFGPINSLFPLWWVNLERTDRLAFVTIPLYLTALLLITGPLLYLFSRLSGSRALDLADSPRLLRRIFGFTVATMIVLLFTRGLLSTDVYNYTWYSRIWVDFGVSPYTHAPVEFPPDPEGSIYWIGWPRETAVYGPAWMIVSAAPHIVSKFMGGTFASQLLFLRLLADAAHLLNAWLIWSIAGIIFSHRIRSGKKPQRRRPNPPLRTRSRRRARSLSRRVYTIATQSAANQNSSLRLAALLFYIWNPLVLVEFAGNAHNDVVMLTFVLLAVWLHLKGRWRFAALALGIAGLVKLPAMLLLPGYIWLLYWQGTTSRRFEGAGWRREGAWRAAQALAIVLAAWVALYLPFWEGTRTLQSSLSGPASRLYLHSIAADILWNAPGPLGNIFNTGEGNRQFILSVRQYLDANLRWWFLGILGMVAVAVTWRARTFPRMVTTWGWLMVAAIMAQGWFWPWYVTWALVPASLSGSRRLRNTTLIFSVSALLLYLEEQILGQYVKFFHDWRGLLVMGPPLLYIVASWLRERGARKRLPVGEAIAPAVLTAPGKSL